MTPTQIDDIIRIFGKLVDSVPMLLTLLMSFLGLLSTLFLAVRQYLNKKDTDTKLAENTAVTHEAKAVAVEAKEEAKTAFTEANNLNTKLESIGIQTKPGEVPLGTDAEHPVHVANHTPAQ